jgi:molybdate transport system substrate-binding protein
MKIRATLFLLLMLASSQLAHAQEITVAAAADLTYCLPEINAAFQKANPSATVKTSFGSSGNLVAEIRNGAPFDVFLSADISYPQALAKDGLSTPPIVYAQGRLVLWTMNPKFDLSKGLAALNDPSITHIALANPDHAPYGRAAKAALQHEHLWDALSPKFVFGENIAQTAQFVQTGNAEAGFVAKSLTLAPAVAGKGSFFEVPASDYPPINQAAALTKAGESKPAAVAYLAFLQSDDARKILEHFGFRLPK